MGRLDKGIVPNPKAWTVNELVSIYWALWEMIREENIDRGIMGVIPLTVYENDEPVIHFRGVTAAKKLPFDSVYDPDNGTIALTGLRSILKSKRTRGRRR